MPDDTPSQHATPGSISTGIPALDGLLRGGLPANRLHLIEGYPGTGKTTLALQFLLEGRRQGDRGLYVTLSETLGELAGVASSHGWSLEGLETCQLAPHEGRAAEDQYTLYHPSEIELAEMVGKIMAATERVRPSRVVLDSLSELRLLARDPLRYRRQVLALKEFFSGRTATVLMLDDRTSGADDLQLQSLAHGVILLEQEPFEYGRSRRRLRIVKLRGVPAREGFHDFKIERGGLLVFPQLEPSSRVECSSSSISSGNDALDRLLGGGLTWGTCTLVMGPAGTGKSTLAAQYIYEAGASASMYLFDERRAMLLARCKGLGMDMQPRLATGELVIEQVEPGDVSPGEFAHRVRKRVEQDGCRIVVIDSLNGYVHAIPTVESPLVRMHELIAYLNEKGVATILIAAQHGIIGSSMTNAVDVSYLADCVILLRYFEAAGAVRKAISVVKKRSGQHEATIREFAVGPRRVRVGEPLAAFHGVMTGVPQYVGEASPLLDDQDTADR
jgi:circadian clock protein KaiC